MPTDWSIASVRPFKARASQPARETSHVFHAQLGPVALGQQIGEMAACDARHDPPKHSRVNRAVNEAFVVLVVALCQGAQERVDVAGPLQLAGVGSKPLAGTYEKISVVGLV